MRGGSMVVAPARPRPGRPPTTRGRPVAGGRQRMAASDHVGPAQDGTRGVVVPGVAGGRASVGGRRRTAASDHDRGPDGTRGAAGCQASSVAAGGRRTAASDHDRGPDGTRGAAGGGPLDRGGGAKARPGQPRCRRRRASPEHWPGRPEVTRSYWSGGAGGRAGLAGERFGGAAPTAGRGGGLVAGQQLAQQLADRVELAGVEPAGDVVLDAAQVGRRRVAQPGPTSLGDHRERATRVRRTGLTGDQSFGGQPVHQPGEAGTGQQYPIGEIGHPKPPARLLGKLDENVVRGQRQVVLDEQVVLEPAGEAGVHTQERAPDCELPVGEPELVGSPGHPSIVVGDGNHRRRYDGLVVTSEQVTTALAGVRDPDIRRPITELGMVKNVAVTPSGAVTVAVWLTVPGCPMRETITRDVSTAVAAIPGVSDVSVELDVMSDSQRRELQDRVRGGTSANEIPFAKPGSLTRVYAVASGKGGVGKSSLTVNVAVALAERGLSVGIVDADIYGHSVPRMLGVTGRPTQVEQMIISPQGYGVRVISIGMFTAGNTAVVWRGPMLHRALQQFLADVFWGDLDVLLLDLPPGTGDIAISVAQLLPTAELLLVTTPQIAAAEVAERAGGIALQTHQRIAGVVENMSYLVCAHCGEQTEVFGSGGGATVAAGLSRLGGTHVPLLGQVPLDVRLREGGDAGMPLVLSDPDSPAALALRKIADEIGTRGRSLAGRHLGLTPR